MIVAVALSFLSTLLVRRSLFQRQLLECGKANSMRECASLLGYHGFGRDR